MAAGSYANSIGVALLAAGLLFSGQEGGLLGKKEPEKPKTDMTTPWKLQGPARIVVQICNA